MRDVREMVGRMRRHELDMTNGKAAMFAVVDIAHAPPWHGLGTYVGDALDTEQAIVTAALDFHIGSWAVEAIGPHGERVPIPFRRANVREDTNLPLEVVGKDYKIFQNIEKFRFLDAVMGESGAKWETAGALQGGKRVWMLAQMPQTATILKAVDAVELYALICGGHDGSLAVHVGATTNRVVCNNTLNAALNELEGVDGRQLVIPHRGDLKTKIARARKLFGILPKAFDRFTHQAEALARVSMKETELTGYVENFFPTKLKPDFTDGAALLSKITDSQQDRSEVMRDLLAAHYAETERIAKRNQGILEQIVANFERDPARGSAWGAYNAVSEYADHQARYRSDESRLNSAWFGAGNELKQDAYATALAMAR